MPRMLTSLPGRISLRARLRTQRGLWNVSSKWQDLWGKNTTDRKDVVEHYEDHGQCTGEQMVEALRAYHKKSERGEVPKMTAGGRGDPDGLDGKPEMKHAY